MYDRGGNQETYVQSRLYLISYCGTGYFVSVCVCDRHVTTELCKATFMGLLVPLNVSESLLCYHFNIMFSFLD